MRGNFLPASRRSKVTQDGGSATSLLCCSASHTPDLLVWVKREWWESKKLCGLTPLQLRSCDRNLNTHLNLLTLPTGKQVKEKSNKTSLPSPKFTQKANVSPKTFLVQLHAAQQDQPQLRCWHSRSVRSQEAEHGGNCGCSPAPCPLPRWASETERLKVAGLSSVIAHNNV